MRETLTNKYQMALLQNFFSAGYEESQDGLTVEAVLAHDEEGSSGSKGSAEFFDLRAESAIRSGVSEATLGSSEWVMPNPDGTYAPTGSWCPVPRERVARVLPPVRSLSRGVGNGCLIQGMRNRLLR